MRGVAAVRQVRDWGFGKDQLSGQEALCDAYFAKSAHGDAELTANQ
jgi:hypothetical protein